MRRVIKKLMTLTKEARVGVLVGAIALMLVGGITFARTWWKSPTSSSNNPTSNSGANSSGVTPNTSSNAPVVLPVEEQLGRPFIVVTTVARGFYDTKATLEEQAAAIVYYDGKYMPSNGVDYVSSAGSFDIIAACSGTVSDIVADPIYGLTVTIESVSNIKTIYASLEKCQLQVGDSVSIGEIIGTTGESPYGSELNTSFLHFEVYKDKQVLNPEKQYGFMLKDIN